MSVKMNYVGRTSEIGAMQMALLGQQGQPGKLTIQSIEGPGGIGKTALLEHAIWISDLSQRGYLTMRIGGHVDGARSTVRALRHLIDSATTSVPLGGHVGQYFPSVAKVAKEYELICKDATEELIGAGNSPALTVDEVMALIDGAVALGKPLNDAIPRSKQYLDVDSIAKNRETIELAVKTLGALATRSVGMIERLTLRGRASLRNAIKDNALEPLAAAFSSDLAAMLRHYEIADVLKPMARKAKGVDRLLLIIDDYEHLGQVMGKLLVESLLPRLRTAQFESLVVIIGRDQLAATDTAWDQEWMAHMLPTITLEPLQRDELFTLVSDNGVTRQAEKQRAWRDTQGYPFYVQLWLEEASDGGRTALMLKRFHDRTTRWMTPLQKRWLEHALFLEEVNLRTFEQSLKDPEQARDAFKWFASEGSVRDPANASFCVREYLRSRLLDYMKLCDPDKYARMSAQSGATDKAASAA